MFGWYRLVSLVSVQAPAVLLLGLLVAHIAGATHLVAQAPPPPAAAKPLDSKQPPAAGQSALPVEIATALAGATATLTDVEKALRNLSQMEGDLAGLRDKVEEVLDNTSRTAEALRPQLAAIKSQIAKLGPAPGKDGPAEAPEVADERSRLTAQAAIYDGAIKSSELTWVRARQLIERITVLRHSLFTKNLMERQVSLLTPGAWREIVSSISSVHYQFTAWGQHLWDQVRERQTALGLILAGSLALFVILRIVLRRATRRPARQAEPPQQPTFFERGVSAVRVAAMRTLPVLVAGFVLYVGLDALDLLQGNPWGRLFPVLLRAVFVFAAISALVRAVLAPAEPPWRLVPLADRPARRLARLLSAIAAVYTLDGVLTEVCRAFYVPLTLSVAQSIASSLAFAALLMGVLLTPFSPPGLETPASYSRHRPRWLKLPLWIVAIGIVAGALLGYVALARFAAQQLLLTSIVVLLGWLGYLAIRAFTREPAEQSRAASVLFEQRLGLDGPRRQQLARLTELALTFALAICALPFLMLQWGFSTADIRDWLASLLFGIEIGQFRISLVRILVGIVLFTALLLATRLFQRWLRDRMLQSRMDASIANSIETVVGYACVALAALIAVSYAGFDITNLAIVAGALSLGIGFGLQSIVNNFVSGLILLVERPIKVGDRVVIGDQQGYVRRISVRATEIETFDRSSVLVPNSDLITGRVVNWTHRDWLAAVNVKVGVAYDADPEQVIATLKKCAEDHPEVLNAPPPSVALEGFGDSALQFNLRVVLPNIDKAAGVQSDLRVAILKALREARIEIPFNQIDVTLRDLETMRRYLDEVLERPSNGVGGHRSGAADAAQRGAAKKS